MRAPVHLNAGAGPSVKPVSDQLSLGLDIGGSSVKAAVLQHGPGRPPLLLATGIRPLGPDRHVLDAVEIVVGMAHQLLAAHGEIAVIGIGLPGIFDAHSGAPTVLPNFPEDWIEYPIRRVLEGRLRRAVHLVNDAKAFSFAEARMGAGVGARTVACAVLGTGVGGGIVIDGDLWSGQGTAGELGHITVALDGPPCGCGNTGCVEAFAGSEAIASFGGRPTAKDVFDAVAHGDTMAVAAVDRAVSALGAGLANVYITIAPDLFVIGGGIAGSADQIIPPLEREIRRRVRVAPASRIRVVAGTLGRNAGAIGAALMAWAAAPVPPFATERAS